ncbi:hypothetical protein WJ69_34315 [Burkholderia ubonensis]|uniref:transcriptional regulator n=1 Tax=Burkholderia ubonensis TaxID=101571 RepID=UPI00075566C0|nr:hypothetical protein [Burkholderia ubonensis]KVN98532.1 hypothetical protein WJ69_34315 [Burkholderia ubonensis]
MEYFFTDDDSRFLFEERVRLIINLQTSVKKYLSKNESVMLACLLGGVQSRERLMSTIWFDQGVVVTNASYYQLIAQLRKSFDEIGLPKDVIKTIPRFGLELTVRRDSDGGGAAEPVMLPRDEVPEHVTPSSDDAPTGAVFSDAGAALQQLASAPVQVPADAPVAHRPVAEVPAVSRAGRGIFTFLRGCCRALMQEAGQRLR